MPADLTREEIARLPDVLAEMESRLHFGGDPEDDRPATEVWSELWFCDADHMVVFKAARSTLSEPARITALEAENAALREALRPFAEEADEWEGTNVRADDADPVFIGPDDVMETGKARFVVGDLRRARALLQGGADA